MPAPSSIQGAAVVLVAAGGSASTDGGAGMVQALGGGWNASDLPSNP